MRLARRWLLVMAIVVGVAAVAALLAVVGAPEARAQDEETQQEEAAVAATQERTITVQGQARVAATPDEATVRLGVVTQAPTATAALSENASLMQEVISATLALEIDEEQVRTETVQLFPVYSSAQPVDLPGSAAQQEAPEIVAYRATNVVSVTVEDVEMVADLLDAATAAGANSVEGISFDIADRSALLANARRQAMRDARERAETYLEETDATLGEVLHIREQTAAIPFGAGAEFAVAADARVPVQPGQQAVDVTVEVVWRLE
jgi:uncharacterized protein